MRDKRVTICACASRSFIDKNKVGEIAEAMKSEGYLVTIIPDLCRMIMQSSAGLSEIASHTICACYPRAVHALFQTQDIVPEKIVDIRNSSIQEICSQLNIIVEEQNRSGNDLFMDEIGAFPVETGRDAWYPVIDKDKCSECEKCHDFCLFGVYSNEGGRVRVTQPQNCKNNCPACARICPSKAIIFPKYEKSPINGGLQDEEQALALDTKKVYADALRMRLEQRRASVSLLKRDNK
ncbi:ferredoxin family protein [Parabacteroides sp. PF5-9]|uniref:ATP-binding protein n=1 Tax=Parabacteroides sp. PF5-9 TaxID=1742404 RepID=UPI002476BE40|nr:ferredoxin family protein [Parabacteroides sp. PF5-9]MDH6358467.1 NAD-dependent dihydropyrimidine dehydrogenase PreA subunit [Parabacteroides sp. PF5-9]